MPPSRSTRSRADRSQSTLNFSSSKRGSPAVLGKKTKSNTTTLKKSGSQSGDNSLSSDSDDEIVEHRTSQKRKRSAGKKPSATKMEEEEEEEPKGNQRPELKIHSPRYRKIAVAAREVNGNLQLIHAEGENKIHDILRVFDMSEDYGPCYGMSRLDRWERAEALGLNPPPEIREILTTRQGVEDIKYAQCVLFGQSELI